MFALFRRQVYQMEGESDSSISPKKRWPLVLIISVTVTLALLSTGIIISVVLFPKNEPSQSSPVFEMQTQRLVKTMNSSCDRCNDFYGYVCGLFDSQYVLPTLSTKFGFLDVAKQSIHNKLRVKLNETEPKLKFVKYLSTFYDECSSRKFGLEKLKQFFANVSQPMDINSLMAKALVYVGSSIVDVKVKPNPVNNGSYAIWIAEPKFNILPQDLVDDTPEVLNAYRVNIEAQATNIPSLEPTELIHQAIKFEGDLAKIAKMAKASNPEEPFNVTTLGNLAKYSGKIDWIQVFAKIGQLLDDPQLLTPETPVVLDGESYFASLPSLLSQHREDQTVEMYILLRILHSYSFSLANHDSFNFAYMKNSNLDINSFDRNDRCMEVLIDTVPHLMGRLLYESEDGANSGETVDKVTEMVSNIKSVLIEQIKNNGWIGEDTKKKLIAKIESNLVKVAYPSFLSQDEMIDGTFQLEPKNGSSAGDLLIELKKFSFKGQIKQLAEQVDPSNWTISSASSNIIYDKLTNSLTIPAGALNELFFHLDQPDYINYASLGVSIAHHLMHSFSLHNLCFDQNGHANKNWLPETFLSDFYTKSECLVDLIDEVNKKFESNIDGSQTLDENLADVQALKLAYESFNMFTRDRQTRGSNSLTQQEGQMSSEQLFLIFYQSNFCQIETQHSNRVQLKFDPHVGSKMRTIVPILNLKQFAEQFNCTIESKFTSQVNCPVW